MSATGALPATRFVDDLGAAAASDETAPDAGEARMGESAIIKTIMIDMLRQSQ
ncbi:MAG: hypothetical protein P8Z00_23190 [Anaerolineales bacterium]